MQNRIAPNYWALALLLAANLSLLLPGGHLLRVAGALLLVGLLPGWGWSRRLLARQEPLLRWVAAAALSFTLTMLAALLLHYWPGPIPAWQLLLVLNIAALPPLLLPTAPAAAFSWRDALPLLLILLASLFLRAANLNYSEFQGDEALAMIAAAESIEGHADALFLRSKGPAEVLLPLAVWRLTGVINEATARLPFTVASLLAVVTIYLIGNRLGGARAGWLAAGFFAFNGFMVAFGRIVQYQALVVWLSALAFLLALAWQAAGQRRLALLAGLSLGAGLLAHYDAVLALPALGWLLLAERQGSGVRSQESGRETGTRSSPLVTRNSKFKIQNSAFAILLFTAGLLAVALPFYLPFALNPQANRTGDYLGGRIGSELRNNLPDFFHFNTFYSSSYAIIVTGLLVLFFLALLAWRAGRWGKLAGGAALVGVIAVVAAPRLLAAGLDGSIAPFALLLLAAFAALFFEPLRQRFGLPLRQAGQWQAAIVWLAVPFLGYNFVVALGLTHIYTTVPAWALLAALGAAQLGGRRNPVNAEDVTLSRRRPVPVRVRVSSNVTFQKYFRGFFTPLRSVQNDISSFRITALAALFFGLSTIFLWNAFVRHDVEYWQDYPVGNLALFWTPYPTLPQAGFFGFAHHAGWKAVGQALADGSLTGDYGSNEEPDVTTWYTRGAPRACDPRPEYYFLAADLIDPVDVPADVIAAEYAEIGRVELTAQKSMRILQQLPAGPELGPLDEAALARQFDAGATPDAFARSARGSQPADANFGRLVRLVGFDLDSRRAWPGGRVPVTLYWQALAPIPASYQVFTHLETSNGPAAQADGVPVCWSYPTDAWRPGQIIADQHAIPLPADIAPGVYPLEIGLYLPDTFARLDLLDAAGNPAGTSLTLAQVEIRAKK